VGYRAGASHRRDERRAARRPPHSRRTARQRRTTQASKSRSSRGNADRRPHSCRPRGHRPRRTSRRSFPPWSLSPRACHSKYAGHRRACRRGSAESSPNHAGCAHNLSLMKEASTCRSSNMRTLTCRCYNVTHPVCSQLLEARNSTSNCASRNCLGETLGVDSLSALPMALEAGLGCAILSPSIVLANLAAGKISHAAHRRSAADALACADGVCRSAADQGVPRRAPDRGRGRPCCRWRKAMAGEGKRRCAPCRLEPSFRASPGCGNPPDLAQMAWFLRALVHHGFKQS
jgi:hypothetical protein